MKNPDGILLGFGGQPHSLWYGTRREGILEKYNVRVLGTGIHSHRMADDRELFKQTMLERGIPVPKSGKASTVGCRMVVAGSIGYPVIVRSLTLLGAKALESHITTRNFARSLGRDSLTGRIRQVLVEEYLDHWKGSSMK